MKTGEKKERLWFNPSMDLSEASDSRMHARSTADTEREAVLWAEKGVVRVRDIINDTRIMGHSKGHRIQTTVSYLG